MTATYTFPCEPCCGEPDCCCGNIPDDATCEVVFRGETYVLTKVDNCDFLLVLPGGIEDIGVAIYYDEETQHCILVWSSTFYGTTEFDLTGINCCDISGLEGITEYGGQNIIITINC